MAELPPIKPVVAEQLPNTYQALQSSGASQQEQAMVEALASAYAKGNQLRKLPQDVARNEYTKLSDPAKNDIKALFGNDPYLQQPPSILQRVENIGKQIGAAAISPLGYAAFKLAPAYNQAINAPVRAGFQAGVQKQGLFSKGTWSTAYQGKDLYNPNDVKMLMDKYGEADATVAMGIVAGKTPAEIMQGYKNGTWDPAIGTAFAKSLDDPNFQKIVDDVKFARFSPGRSLIRSETNYGEAQGQQNGGLLAKIGRFLFKSNVPLIERGVGQSDADYKKQLAAATIAYQKRASGAVDAVYQTVIDPLTWFTGGGDKALTAGSKLAQGVRVAAQEGRLEEGVAQAFKNPQVAKLWDEQLGPALKKVADAKTPVEKAQAREAIQTIAPSYNDNGMIRALTKPGKGIEPVVDAKTAQDFFSQSQNTHMLLSGRVDGTNFYRNGIATARNNRIIDQGRAASIDAIFNPTLQNLTTREALNAAGSKGEEIWKTLTTVGSKVNQGVNPDVVKLQELNKDISSTRQAAYKLGTLFARSPGRGFILYGDEAYKTIDTFERVARLVVPRDMAKIIAQHYLAATPDEQLAAVRNLYFAYMQKQGLEGSAKGREFIEAQLNKTMNPSAGMGASGITPVPDHFARVVSKNTVKWENDEAVIANAGAHVPSQLTNAVGALDYMAVARVRAITERLSFITAFDKATQSAFLRGFTNLWSFFTLIPRLGIRGASDEFFFYLFQQPLDDVLRFVSGGARREANVLTMVSGSKESVGPIRRGLNKAFFKGGPEDYLTLEKRSEIINTLAERLSVEQKRVVTPEDIQHLLIREETAQRAWDVLFKDTPSSDHEAIINGLKYQPDFLNGTVNALTARTSMTGKFAEDEFKTIMFQPSAVDKALKDVGTELTGKGLKAGRQWYNIPASELQRAAIKYGEEEVPWWYGADKATKANFIDKFITLSHFDNWGLRFAYNQVELDGHFMFNPVPAFLGNGALKTDVQVEKAVKSLLQDVGVKWDGAGSPLHEVVNPKRLQAFNTMFGDTIALKQRGIDDIEIARVHIETMLTDMYIAFHGGKEGFNTDLYNHIKMAYEDTFEQQTKSMPDTARWQTAARKIEFEDFDKLTNGKHPVTGGINTRIIYPDIKLDNLEPWYKQFGNSAYEAMDRTINGMFRQRALTITYARIYKEYKPFQEIMTKNLQKSLLEAEPFLNKAEALSRAQEIAAIRYTEIAMHDATNTILKYADNPDIRSNFSVAVTTVGRFYRANEDFMRRAYRQSKDAPLRTLYRMRLLHTGLAATGSVYTDKNGNQYIVAPTDSVLFAPVSAVMSKFYSGASGTYKSAQFDEVKMKLELINPSFSGDAGEPMLSGPASAVAIWAVKGLLDSTNTAVGTKTGQVLNAVALGSIGNNITLRKAIVPMLLDNIYQMLSPVDSSREEVTAGVQAIDYMYAHNHGLPDNPTAKQQRDFLQNVRIAAHSILFMRALLGMVSPITPTLQESKGLPAYYKAMGVTGLRPEFFQILQGIKDTYGNDVQDPYGLATAMFVGQNPGKSIYTASRTSKQYHVLLTANQSMMDWTINHSDFVATYGDAALVFAPQIGKFNANVYNWMQSQDMSTLPSIDAYFQNAQVAQAKNNYFAISSKEKADLTNNIDLTARQQIIQKAAQDRQALLAGNPFLVQELGASSSGGKGRDQITFDRIKQVLADSKSPITTEDRANMNAASKIMDGFLGVVTDPEFKGVSNFNEIKLQTRQQAEASLVQLANTSPAVKEAYTSIFTGIMNAYVPEKNVVLSKGNG